VLDYLVVQMYSRGLSTRDIEEAPCDPVSAETLLSKSAVSEVTDRLWEDYLAFCRRDLSAFPVEYVFMDGLYEGMRLHPNPSLSPLPHPLKAKPCGFSGMKFQIESRTASRSTILSVNSCS
jgi:hypothetical protein